MKVSVIVAAYNAEKYLTETLESITHQTLDDYEIIIVNDGSTDSTQQILEIYQESYSNIKVVNKENGGPSSARNTALDLATGEYIYFFDADDILISDALECLYNRAKEQDADLVIAKYDMFDQYKTYNINNIDGLVAADRVDKYNLEILWTFALWNKLYRKSLIDQYQFRFPPISYTEDGAFVMEFVYHTANITGLDKVVCHYRRMFEGENTSITASVSPSKIKDYITAHKLILKSAERSILRDYPEYSTIEEARENNLDIHKYLCEIIRKELQILLGQFYVKFWSLDESTVRLLTDEIEEKIQWLDMRSVALLADAYPEFVLQKLAVKSDEILEEAYFTVALYGEKETEKDFLNCLKSLTIQKLIAIEIWLPQSMKEYVDNAGVMQGNIRYVPGVSKKEFQYYALDNAKTPYITFCDEKVAYANNVFRIMMKRFVKSPADFIIELMYHRNYGDSQPVFYNNIAMRALDEGKEYKSELYLDYTLANKFFKTKFLRENILDRDKDILEQLERLYQKGYYVCYEEGNVIYTDTERSFLTYINTPETEEFIKGYMDTADVTLKDLCLSVDTKEAFPKLQSLPAKTYFQRFIRKSVSIFRKLPLKDRVLFLTIRKDRELEGNTKALYPWVKSRKVICAEQLPHGFWTSLKMFYYVITSKVIITDDYVKYLRHIPMRPEQKVIQLWHACGAFKKFGQRGTNLSLKTDLATHAQYNLVTVSGEHIRTIYADAFGINVKKVHALGCPRTDDFYNQDLILEKRERIYAKYPELKDKYVIIYAPTFRDIGKDRTQFHPELDFDRLSKELLDNQILLICPHPLMKNDIIPKAYPNIKVIRDFSTNDLMFISNLLITDYSSVIFEYVLLKKPIAFFCYDLITYNRGFYLNYPDDLPGPVYENQDTLMQYLQHPEDHVIDDKYNLFIEKYMSGCDGHSSERIAKIIDDYMGEGK